MAAGLHQDHLPPCSGGRTLGQDTTLAVDHRALTLVIFLPPEELQLPKRFSEIVRTLEARWMVKRLLAGTFFLHLPRKSSSYSSCSNIQTAAHPGHAAMANLMGMVLLTPGTAPDTSPWPCLLAQLL